MSIYGNALNLTLAHCTGLDLPTQVSGNFTVSNFNSGTGASGDVYFRGDNTWSASPLSTSMINLAASSGIAAYTSTNALSLGTLSSKSVIGCQGSAISNTVMSSDGQLLISSSTGAVTAAFITANNSTMSVTNSANLVTLNANNLPLTVVSATTQAIAASATYLITSSTLCTLTLSSSSSGSTIRIIGSGAGGWKIAQAANVFINVGAQKSTTGVTGSVSSTNQYDSVTIINYVLSSGYSVLGAPQSAGLTVV